MPEDRQQVKRLLTELRAQLASSPSVDPATQVQLEATIADVEQALTGAPQPRPRGGTLAKRLSTTAADFEASHPTLAVTLSGLIDILGQLGI